METAGKSRSDDAVSFAMIEVLTTSLTRKRTLHINSGSIHTLTSEVVRGNIIVNVKETFSSTSHLGKDLISNDGIAQPRTRKEDEQSDFQPADQ